MKITGEKSGPEITNIHEAKTHLSRLVERAAAGEVVVIGKAGKPMAKLVKFDGPKPMRVPGAWKGKVWIKDDATFDDPLEDLERAIEESEIEPPA